MHPQPKFIAEVADNHGGDISLAKEFIRVFADIGVDYVKFQSWQISRVRDRALERHYDWLVRAELSDAQHVDLMEECNKRGVKFLTTVFDSDRVEFLATLGLESIKVGSGEVSDHKLLRTVRKYFKHIMLSTGMHTGDEVKEAVRLLSGGSFSIFHCVSIYPHDIERVNLSRMVWLRQYCDSVGFSDHSVGIEAAKMALVLGAEYIERHTCLGRDGPGRVNPWDTTPEQWKELVKYRDIAKNAWGEGDIPLVEEEMRARHRFIGRWKGGSRSSSK